jgi:hypothetical protein
VTAEEHIMDNRNMSLGSESIDWGDPAFAGTEFQDSVLESPYGTAALNDFTNLADYSDSPNFTLRTPSKADADSSGARGTLQPAQAMAGASSKSAESSSQDSSSDSSSRRKRKTTSESPMSDALMMQSAPIKEEGTPTNIGGYQNMRAFEQNFNPGLPNLSVDQPMSDNDAMFDFNSAASSPNLPRDFNQQLSLNAKMNTLSANAGPGFHQESPVRAINPGVFMTGSRDQSPATANMMFNAASPNAVFSTPSSDSNDTFGAGQNWGQNMVAQNPAWPADFTSQFASPGGLAFTPSPAANGGTPAMSSRGIVSRGGRSPLHIAPISTKSRVETQINIIMTLERPPPGIEHLHLPLHTIAKSKLLAKEDYDQSKVLELHTMLVCSSAMHNATFKEKALKRAAAQNNIEIQKRAEQQRESGDDEKNDMKNLDEEDKPANGGEVRICSNCIQRERKRAGRKKLKKEEEQQHWERYETERVVVFNSNEYLPFKPFDPSQQPQRDSGMNAEEPYRAPEAAISVAAAMRIACYCRHQSEKEGFQVIFTLKDQHGNVVAQEMSDSILITDDHKTHPPQQLTAMASDVLFHPQLGANGGLPTSYSMMDLQSHAQPFTSSRSAGNLQALAYNQQSQFNPHSHIHQLPNNGFGSHATSATMTPTNLSRPGSPTSAGQSGPNKKRKSSTFHKRLPSGLHMTPRVDTSQPQAASAIPGMSMPSNFSPTGFGQQNDQSYMTVPNSANQAQFFGSGPPTPANEQGQFGFGHPHQLDITRAQNASAYFSHPSSAVPSRSNSPTMHQRGLNMGGFQRPVQTTTNQLNRNSGIYGGQTSAGGMQDDDQPPAPTMTKITPNSGPVSGGTEVSIFGYNFTHHTQIMFGDSIAPTTFYGSQCILATSPPGRRGQVPVKIVPSDGAMQYLSSQGNNHIFEYKDTNPQMMEMALRLLSQQQTGDSGQWIQFTNQVANQFMQTSISPAGIHGQGYGGGNMLAADGLQMEDVVLKVFELVDLSESPRQPWYDMWSEGGETMLTLAAVLGMHRVAGAVLARGANPDVRDKGGYTALMHAALHGRCNTFQLLLAKGADPSLRSLKGYTAIDLVYPDEKETFVQVLQNTRRSRSGRPSFHMRHSYGSFASSKSSWDISSASFYESEAEADASEHTVSMPASRRASGNPPLQLVEEQEAAESQAALSAAMIAWRDALAGQIYHFQRTFHSSMTSFQLPALPPLPDYQDNAMVRRLSSLVPSRYSTRPAAHVEGETPHQPTNPQSRFWDMFSSASPTVTTPPPSYAELFPDEARGAGEEYDKKSSIQTAVVDAVADHKCSLVYDQVAEEPSAAISEDPKRPKKTDRASALSWLWVSEPSWWMLLSAERG